ncbi:PREDICTED: uncharacterized protein LOC107189851 isoform X2 [Dufourea novaeangliae]|uniref:uncharacterized protein LOC107189851 isoform X2 n=1 Tax=Dufourea novaeangliae TaxID=178035 RepID=UPI00076736A9|nr:PREDICTED: uncharacterized protein LOC107189851 isoform X2 [Dufourea novaeangliae]
MTTAVVYIQRCIVVLAILLCYFHVRGERVDCEGTMSRKRAMFPTIYGSGCDGSKGNVNCIREFEDRHRIPYIPLSKSRLLITLLDNDPPKDATYMGRHRQRNNEMDERRPPLMENFLSELESSDSNY